MKGRERGEGRLRLRLRLRGIKELGMKNEGGKNGEREINEERGSKNGEDTG
jgi:hypothetical protein